MTERLRRVSQLLAAACDLFGEHAQVVRETEHILKKIDRSDEILGLIDAGAGHGLNEPESTHAEGSLRATNSVIGELSIITVYQARTGQSTLLRGEKNAIECVGESWVARRDEEDEGCDEDGRVKHCVVFKTLNETFHFGVVAFLHDSLVKLVPGFHPFGAVGAGETSLFREAETTVKSNPEHDLRVGEVLLVVSDFPDGHVGFVDDCQDIIENVTDSTPYIPGNWFAKLVVQIDGIHEFTIDIKLLMECRAVTDSNGTATTVPLEVV